jgi:hypothetical protein
MVATGNAVGIAEEEAARSDGINVFHVGGRGANKFSVVISDVATDANLVGMCAGSVPGGKRVKK